MPEVRPRVAHELPPRDDQAQVFPGGGPHAPRPELEQVRPGDRRDDGGVGGHDHRTGPGASRPPCTTVPTVDAALADRLAIRDVVETWANARDSRDWEAFRACWHEDGYMMATWFQGPKEDFIRVSQEGAARGVNILHFTGGVRITLAGTRAIAQTRMTIMQRGQVHGVVCDVACTGRFYDFFEQRGVGPAATGGQASSVVPPEPT